MKKVTYTRIDLSCTLQQVGETDSKCLRGILSQDGDRTFRFEETISKGRSPLNPKLYDGKYLSMVRRQNGKYQFHMKALADGFDKEKLPHAIYSEVSAALQILD